MSARPTGDTHIIQGKPSGRGCACGIVVALCAALLVGAVLVVGVVGIMGAMRMKTLHDGATLPPPDEWESLQEGWGEASGGEQGSWGELRLIRDSHVYAAPDASSASLRAMKPGDEIAYYGFDDSFGFYSVRHGDQVGYLPLMDAEISFD